MSNPLLATKTFDQIETEHTGSPLKRALGPWQLTLLGVGCTIGTGIFVLTGLQAAQHAGPAIVLSFIIAGLGSLFAGLCYAEFSSMVPLAGSAYTYSYATLGEFAAWFIGWDLLLEYAVAAGTVAVGWSRYFVKFLHQLQLDLPAALTSAPFQAVTEGSMRLEKTGAIINLPAFAIALFAAGICYVGISESARVNAFVVMLKISVIVAVIGCGAFFVSSANWHPFIPPNTGAWGNFGWSGVLRASGVIFFAYIGFDAVSTAAQEARNPHRDVPFGLLMGLGICTLLYILMAAVLTGLVPYPQLNDAAPVAVALEAHPQLKWLSVFVVPGALLGLTSVILVLILAQARILLAMSTDGLLPAGFGAVHEKFRTPHVATLVTGIFAALLGGLFPIGILSELVSIGTLLAFVMVCLGVLVLRYTRPAQPRPFRVLWPWFTCLAGAASCVLMAVSLPSDTWIRLVIWAVAGILIYIFYSRHHSKLRRLKSDR
ncbi:MAG TPA: amino acid permease [Steroidobacteraceae bacterium]|nr:amino acid permease [Steroidobacteraceae bacterium]